MSKQSIDHLLQADGITRREVLKFLALLTGGAVIGPGVVTACTEDGSPTTSLPPTDITGDLDRPFAVWRMVREALRTSPDHLPSRAEEVIATGDASEIFRFVRDNIQAYPSGRQDMRSASTRVRWGAQATLRGGAGTPRERAELLVQLLDRAGIESRVRESHDGPRPEEVASLLNIIPTRVFAPDVTDEQLEDWMDIAGVTNAEQESPLSIQLDAERRTSRALADSLLNLLPQDRVATGAEGFDFRSGRLPIVEISTATGAMIADLGTNASDLITAARYGEARDAGEATGVLQVSARLEYVTTDSPTSRQTLVTNSWSATDLVGRQIVAQLVPTMTLDEQALATYNDARVFVPVLGVRSPGLPSEVTSELTATGEPISITGAPLVVDGEKASVDGVPLADEGSANLADVSSLEAEVDAGFFPDLRARVRARDARGDLVEGLQAGDFMVEDDASPVAFLLASNTQAPRIQLLIDQSSSMPLEYRGDAGQQLVQRLVADIRTEFPGAIVNLQETDSRLWFWLGRAAASAPTLTVYATDGHVDGELTRDLEAALDRGPPTIILSVTGQAEGIFDQLADVTNGVVVPVEDADEGRAAIVEFVRKQDVPPYVLDLAASGEEPHERVLTIQTSDGRLSTEVHYTVPGQEERVVPRRIYGLYLTLEIGGEGHPGQTITRALGGYDERFSSETLDEEVARDAHAALFGTYLVHVEGGSPPLSVWLDEFITGQLTLEPYIRALAAGNGEDLKAALESGVQTVPPVVYSLTGPIAHPSDTPVYEDGLRMILYRVKPVFGTDFFRQAVDILPTAAFYSVHEDPREAFANTTRATATLAVAESELFDLSTLGLLEGAGLHAIENEAGIRPGLSDKVLAAWEYLIDLNASRSYHIAPRVGEPLALWNIDVRSGELAGLLADRSAGGTSEQRILHLIDHFQKVLTSYSLLIGALGVGNLMNPIGGTALSVVAEHGKNLVRLFGSASLAILALNAYDLQGQARNSLIEFACGAAQTLTNGVLGPIGGDEFALYEALMTVLSVLFPESPVSKAFSCS